MIGFGRIERYIFRECGKALLMVLGIIASAVLVVDLVEQLRTVGTRTDLSLITALYLSILKLPMLIEQALPFAVMIATMVTFRQLSRRAELPVIRASGLSAWRFMLPPALLALCVGLFATLALSPAGARAADLFEKTRAALLDRQDPSLAVFDTGIWFRLGDDRSQTVMHAREVDDTGVLFRDVKLIEQERVLEDGQLSDGFIFRRRIDAARARLGDGFWQLEDLVENIPGEAPRHYDQLALPTSIEQATLMDRFAPASTIGFWQLPGHITETRQAGLNVTRYQVRWHGLIAAPALYIAMALIGALACLRLARLGGTAKFASLAVLSALGLFFVTRFASGLSSIGLAPPIVTAWTPPLFAIFACLAIIAFQEDG